MGAELGVSPEHWWCGPESIRKKSACPYVIYDGSKIDRGTTYIPPTPKRYVVLYLFRKEILKCWDLQLSTPLETLLRYQALKLTRDYFCYLWGVEEVWGHTWRCLGTTPGFVLSVTSSSAQGPTWCRRYEQDQLLSRVFFKICLLGIQKSKGSKVLCFLFLRSVNGTNLIYQYIILSAVYYFIRSTRSL